MTRPWLRPNDKGIYCDWVNLPFKDKRRGSMWLCKWCRLMRKAMQQPECPLNIDHISTKRKG